ncbi:uncharacterized protein BT62DRAFT_938681, partial [Guyanagaster necrorhizus]
MVAQTRRSPRDTCYDASVDSDDGGGVRSGQLDVHVLHILETMSSGQCHPCCEVCHANLGQIKAYIINLVGGEARREHSTILDPIEHKIQLLEKFEMQLLRKLRLSELDVDSVYLVYEALRSKDAGSVAILCKLYDFHLQYSRAKRRLPVKLKPSLSPPGVSHTLTYTDWIRH